MPQLVWGWDEKVTSPVEIPMGSKIKFLYKDSPYIKACEGIKYRYKAS
ncbi:hypothetical protein [Thermoplasma volcanium]|nr:hypothetical protein [Thermoplasma volcanium]